VPGDVVNCAGALEAALRRVVVAPVEVALVAVEPVLALTERGEPERGGQQLGVGVELAAGVGAGAFDAEDGVLGGHLGVLRSKRALPRSLSRASPTTSRAASRA
jgi:hypothetical protein